MHQSVLFDRDMIERYSQSGPRYTSYPTAVQFNEKYSTEKYIELAKQTNEDLIPSPLSLYFHLPFCRRVCYYCACNKIITNNRNRAKPYLENLHKEIALQGKLFDRDRYVDQLHWGGGTPTFINNEQMRELMNVTRKYFTLRDDDSGEYSIELDPREVDKKTIHLLRELGFNRMSVGVQDFDLTVQKSVNRLQTREQTEEVIKTARTENFYSISIDLIYGLPKQTVESFQRTLELIIELSPDRIAVYNYAHLPGMFKTQKQIIEEDLPSADEKLAILQNTIDQMTQAGYIYIGMDHFAKPDDELAVAQRNGNLHRNFQGYSTHAECDLVGMGITSIGKIGNSYSQNLRTLDEYDKKINEGQLPVFRGIELDKDDILRREVIMQLICQFHLDIEEVENKFKIDFADYFYNEKITLEDMQADNLLNITDNCIDVTPTGRLLIRNICMVFDRYLKQEQEKQRFSKVI